MSKSHYDTAAMRFYKVAKVAYWRSRKASFSPISSSSAPAVYLSALPKPFR